MTTVLVTRPAGAADPLVVELEARGYRVSAVPTVVTRPLAVSWPDLAAFDWVVVTSAAGVQALPAIPGGPRWAAVGESTAGALGARGATVDLVPSEANGAALADSLPDPAGKRVLLVRGAGADPDLPAGLRARGAVVEEVTAYETVEGPAESTGMLRDALGDRDVAAVVFASGSAVRGFVKLGGGTALPAITIGPRTSLVARNQGFQVIAEAAAPGVAELAATVAGVIPAVKPAGPHRPRRLRTRAAVRALVRETRVHPGQLIAPLFVVSGRGRRFEIPSLPRHASAAVAYAQAGADIVAPSAMMDGQVGALRAGLDGAGFRDTAIMAYASKHASSFYGPFREAAGSAPSFGDRKSYQMDPANAHDALREMELDADEGADILMVKPAITSLDLLAR